MELARPDD
ncbi:hypothetical protein RDI58_022594 [Solanum bulbocastanum]|uniref:Uncharacterized protein n=1 Tax=Solanum bulbocastanum TaxID=147425 RepID=A0AAN8T2C7_SOLBU